MENKLGGLLMALCGLLLIVASVALELAWLGFCFGTIIIGFLMLLFVPSLLLAPFAFISPIGIGLLFRGISILKERAQEEYRYVPATDEDIVADEARIERAKKLAALKEDLRQSEARCISKDPSKHPANH